MHDSAHYSLYWLICSEDTTLQKQLHMYIGHTATSLLPLIADDVSVSKMEIHSLLARLIIQSQHFLLFHSLQQQKVIFKIIRKWRKVSILRDQINGLKKILIISELDLDKFHNTNIIIKK
jgi:hypothetical protein